MTAPTAPAPDVICRAQQGDEAAFRHLYETYRAPIQNHLYRMTWDWQRAEDLAADAWVKVWLALPKTRRDLPLLFQAFVFRVATNVARDHFRHEKLVQWARWDTVAQVTDFLEAPAGEEPEQAVLAQEVEAEVRAALEGVPAPDRRVLELRAFADLDYDELAARLHLTKSQIKRYLYRGRQQARAHGRDAPRPAPDACPIGVKPAWSRRRQVWRYHVCLWAPPVGGRVAGRGNTSRHFGTYDTLAEAIAGMQQARARMGTPEHSIEAAA